MFKSRKKAFIAISLVLVLTFALSACGGGSSAPSSTQNSSQGSTAVKPEIQKPEDLAGKKVGVQVSTTADDSCKELLKTVKFDLQKYDQIIQTFSDLKTGRLDAVVVDEVVARYYVSKDPQSYKVTGAKLTNEPIGICFKKSNAEMRDRFNAIIDDFAKDGTLKKISEKWFGSDLTSNIQNVGSGTEQGTSNPNAQIPSDKKVLRIGVDDTYPPMEFKDESNKIVGFDVDLAQEIGKKLNMQVEFVPTAWDGIFTSLNTDKFDCIISSVSINEDRLKNFAITKPYVANAQVIVVRP
ncbi:MAG: transporter substrate-binding domain-containing protein [Clostridiales bacterium]|jgi:ABC-type amino acid transport substrate-binding protein|nr:transporter substrate-binding domain-containing protein [Eubacteriales bacterium]MDH7567597.1 transporter substrate-binding domain-containing protein [Clostridiales bacterium]